jgi:hypothetical protein
MRISDFTRYPHPVLGSESEDFAGGAFDVQFVLEEVPSAGRLRINHEITLTEEGIRDFVLRGVAGIGCIVRCEDTYFVELRRLSWPVGRSDFIPGSLINRVTLRPIVWLETGVEQWNPGSIHWEFSPPVSIAPGGIVALGPEYVISVGQAKLRAIESIFELRRADLPAGRMQVSLDGDRIAILVASGTYDAIGLLRGQAHGFPILINGVYLPAVMEVLDLLRSGSEQYDAYRWYRPFMARCDARGIVLTAELSVLESAQTLLDNPAQTLSRLAEEEGA